MIRKRAIRSSEGKVDTRTSRSSVGTWFLFCQPWTFSANVDGKTKSGEPRSRIYDGDFEIFVQRCFFTNPFRVNMLTPALSCFPVWSWQLLFSDISQENGSGRCHKRPCIHCQEQESKIPIVLQLLPVIHWDFVSVKPHFFTDIVNGNQDIEYLLNWMLHLLTNDLRKLAYTQWWMQTTEKRTTSKTILTDLNEYMLPSLFFFLELALILALTCGWWVEDLSLIESACSATWPWHIAPSEILCTGWEGRAEVAKISF